MSRLFLALALLVTLGAASALQAEDRIWSAVLLAKKVDQPKPVLPELASVADKVKRAFDCNQVELVGSATKDIDEGDQCERWLVPTQNFTLNVRAKRAQDDYMLKVQLFQEKRTLAEIEAKLTANAPLLIKGPVHPRGQVVIALQVVK